ncbi:MAG TPA: hypothetical protein VFY91_00635 [Microbacterium sp.]|nr:hypothetical protein [Microbacterium sp.]
MQLRRTRNRRTDQAGNAGADRGDARSRPEGGLMPIATRERYISMLIPQPAKAA